MTRGELFAGRVEESLIPPDAFRAMLAKIAAEFEASQPKRRRGGRRGRSQVEQVEPANPLDDFSSNRDFAELNR
jgi:hypothetical protein